MAVSQRIVDRLLAAGPSVLWIRHGAAPWELDRAGEFVIFRPWSEGYPVGKPEAMQLAAWLGWGVQFDRVSRLPGGAVRVGLSGCVDLRRVQPRPGQGFLGKPRQGLVENRWHFARSNPAGPLHAVWRCPDSTNLGRPHYDPWASRSFVGVEFFRACDGKPAGRVDGFLPEDPGAGAHCEDCRAAIRTMGRACEAAG